MKKSIIFFIAATAIALSLIYFPSLYGNVSLDSKDQPTNSLSKMWMGSKDLRTTKPLDNTVSVVKVIGNGKDLFLNISRSDSATINSREVHKFDVVIHRDTLIIEMKDKGYMFIGTKNNVKEIIVQNTGLRLHCQGEYAALKMSLDQRSRAHITSSEASRGHFVQIDSLDITAIGESVINIAAIKAQQVKVQLNNAELNYNSSLQADTLSVALSERSTVKSLNYTEEQKVKNLVLSGNQQYFKNKFVGQGVQIITKP